MRIYLAGPMRGLKDWNFPAFFAAKARWEEKGHHVFCPATLARAQGYGPGQRDDAEPGSEEAGQHLRHVIASDIHCIFASEGVALLPGWEGSRGATVEVALAQFLGIPLYDAERLDPLIVPRSPWNLVLRGKV